VGGWEGGGERRRRCAGKGKIRPEKDERRVVHFFHRVCTNDKRRVGGGKEIRLDNIIKKKKSNNWGKTKKIDASQREDLFDGRRLLKR